MEQIDFVHLAWAILDDYREEDCNGPFLYEDEFLRIQSDPSPDIILEVTRKKFDDPKRKHLCVENPVVMIAKNDGEDAKIIRYHGEHTVIVPHMLYLLEISETYHELFDGMLEQYPDVDVKFGI